VEDNKETREKTSTIFKNFFQNIITANNGKEGFEKFQKYPVDLIITDIEMPIFNGIEMIEQIRSIDKDVSILILSAHTEMEYLFKSIQYGVKEFILKPINRKKLITSINKIIQEIQEKKSTKSLLEQYQDITDKSHIVSKTDTKGIITYVNNEFCKISQYSRKELVGQNHNIVRSPNMSPMVFKQMWKIIKENKTWQGVIQNQTKDGSLYYVKSTIKPIVNSRGEIEEFIALRTLINDIIHPKQQLFDFIKTMDKSIVILIKIEDFQYFDGYKKELNENMQQEFAIKIFDLIPNRCEFLKIYLLGDGEFAIAKKQNDNQEIEKIVKNIKIFQTKINSAKINMGYIDYDLSVIMSFAYGKDALKDAQYGLTKLLKNRGNFIIANGLSKEGQKKSISRIQTFKMLKKAIDSYNIVSYFQPIINNKTKKIEKYESLVRLIDEKGEVLSPYFFLNASKKGKYYTQITSRVLDNSFKALQRTNTSISINLSAFDIVTKETREKFFRLLRENKKDTHRVVLELIEEKAIEEFQLIQDFIEEIKEMGVRIAIDDFGSGYSSFDRVLDYKPDILKIDGRLIKNLNHDKLSYSIVESIVSFARKEQLQTIAEFVENEEIYHTLCDLGVDYSQGYHFGKPALLP
jgi:PAS domain S-box-containing protein